ncbi:MAG: AsmA-like C-terminal region-containing protein [Bryobacteraceae bacterium]
MEQMDGKRRLYMRRWLIAGVAVLLLVPIAALFIIAPRLGPIARAQVLKVLREKYQSDVELKDLKISLFPRVEARGEGLVMHYHGRTDLPPFISIKAFQANADFKSLLQDVKHVNALRLEGLEIHIPPKSEREQWPKKDSESGKGKPIEIVVDRVVADGSKLVILPKEEGKDPLEWDIHKLTLHSVGAGLPMQFVATLANAKPPGDIQSTGQFGPFDGDDPGSTPVSGKYTFANADLSVFNGISGTLASTGEYQGTLNRIEVDGETDVPDFMVKVAGNPIHLNTKFHSVVDGTSGDTLLEPVTASFLRSALTANGGVTGTKGVPGKTVDLDVVVNQARLQDILKLAIKSSSTPMTGIISFKTKMIIPPGDKDIAEKLRLNGQFGIGAAKFTSLDVQNKVNKLSGRARGDTDDSDAESVLSNLQGRFVLDNGKVTFTKLSFSVPGALIQMAGSYNLRGGELDFHGTARMDAKVSQMTTGFKSLLLKAADPFFKKQGAGAVIPIKITGTRENPSFGLELRRKKS